MLYVSICQAKREISFDKICKILGIKKSKMSKSISIKRYFIECVPRQNEVLSFITYTSPKEIFPVWCIKSLNSLKRHSWENVY